MAIDKADDDLAQRSSATFAALMAEGRMDDASAYVATLSYGELRLFIAGLGRLAAEAVEELVRIRGDDKTAAELLRHSSEESQGDDGPEHGA